MIARGLSNSAICLGCRLRLLRQVARPIPAPLAGQARGLFYRSTQRWFASEASPRTGGRVQEDDNESPSSLDGMSESNPYHEILERQDRLFDVDDGYQQNKRTSLRQREENFRPVKKLDLRRRHVSGKKILTETSESLGSDMLGRPAYAIVMRDGGSYKVKKRGDSTADSAELGVQEKEEFDIQALLDSQLKPPTEAEVRDNINELRPKSEIYLPEKEYRRIQHELEEGFLKSQLLEYLETFKSQNKVSDSVETIVKPKHKNDSSSRLAVGSQESGSSLGGANAVSKEMNDFFAKFKWIIKVSPWVPLTPGDEQFKGHNDSNRHLYGYLSQTPSAKERAAIQIMRECWGLQMEELLIGLGETRITLRSQEFSLLMRGTNRFLRALSNEYLEPGETIETFNNKRMLRIVAPRIKSQSIIADLDTTLQRLQQSTFPVKMVASNSSQISEALMEEVGRITNTHVRYSQTGRRIHVTWLPVSRAEPDRGENLAHVVYRLLLTALQPDSSCRKLYSLPFDTSRSRPLVDHANSEKWSWKEKLGKWARVVVPLSLQHTNDTAKTLPPNPLDKLDVPPQKLPMRFDLGEAPFSKLEEAEEVLERATSLPSRLPQNIALQSSVDTPFPVHPVRWSPDPTTTTAATFGHVLFPLDDLPTTVHKGTSIIPRPQRRRIWSPITPHPMILSRLEAPEHSLFPIESTVLVRMIPSPYAAAVEYEGLKDLQAPNLELRLTLREPGATSDDPMITGIHSLHAITTTHIHDILQPSHPIDLRITQTQSTALQGDSEALERWQPLADFLSRARLDIDAGKLEMPPQQRFPIPMRLFNTARKPVSKEKTPIDTWAADAAQRRREKYAASNDQYSMLYEFVGLELHRSVTVPYPHDERFSLAYTSIEAGQGGGRRAELSLRPVAFSPSSRDSIASPTLQDDYLAACYEFAQSAEYWRGL